MTTVALVADSGRALEALTQGVSRVQGMTVVRHCHGHTAVGSMLARLAPDVVLVDEMDWPRLALQRVVEIRQALPSALMVVRAGRPEASWLAEALRVGADAVVPATAGVEPLGRVLAELVSERDSKITIDSAPLVA
jgi:DNA-binding NarL/FixJ family response regulator